MASSKYDDDELRIDLSVIDRIVGIGSSSHTFSSSRGSVRALKAAVYRDLTELLNTKRLHKKLPRDYPEARSSLLAYGLPDFTSITLSDPDEREGLRRAIIDAIKIFEPRLTQVAVSLEQPAKGTRKLVYRVNALLRMEPVPEPIVFDTVVDGETNRISVSGDDA